MATAEQARQLLSLHGPLQSQPPSEWSGPFALPAYIERFYREVGPLDVCVPSYGNSFFLPSLSRLWPFQAGYRWNGLSGEPIPGWKDDWLVVADQGGDPFILSRSSGVVLHDQHGRGAWDPSEIFPDLETMAACLGQLGAVVVSAGEGFTDEDCRIRAEFHAEALAGLRRLVGLPMDAKSILEALGWG
jgi:hypothetical protein